MTICTQPNVQAVLATQSVALRAAPWRLHARHLSCAQDRDGTHWTLTTRERVTLTLTVKRTRNGQLRAKVVGAVA